MTNQEKDHRVLQNQDMPLETKPKKIIPTRLGSLVILLMAVIAGSWVWWESFSYEEPEPINVEQLVAQLKARRALQQKLPIGYEIQNGGMYYEGLLVSSDAQTFRHIGNEYSKYAKDAEHVYFIPGPGIGAEVAGGDFDFVIEGADPATFEFVASGYGGYTKDAMHVYRGGVLIEGADPVTFEYVDGGYSKDAVHVYYLSTIVEGADLAGCTKNNLDTCKKK